MIAVCAAAISFSALCAGFGNNFTAAQDDLMNKISNREIWVVNATSPNHEENKIYTLPDDLAFTTDELATFAKITELDGIYPYFELNSGMFADKEQTAVDRTIAVTRKDGKETPVKFGSDQKEYNYVIVPYLPDQLMDEKSETLDTSVGNGLYLSSKMAETLGMTEAGATVKADAVVPVKLKNMSFTDQNGKEIQSDIDFCTLSSVSEKVRGILDSQVKNIYSQSSECIIYMPYDQMKTLMDSLKDTKLLTDEKDWQPSALILNAANYYSVTSAKDKLFRLSDHYIVYNRFQDFQSMKESISGIRDMTFTVSVIILVVIFLLMAILCMNDTESRKFEFSILKANGITRREILRLILNESILQAAKTFAISLVFAAALGLITNFVIFKDKMIVFDWALAVTLLAVSFLSIVIPTIVTLVFVNRYDPDQIMRN